MRLRRFLTFARDSMLFRNLAMERLEESLRWFGFGSAYAASVGLLMPSSGRLLLLFVERRRRRRRCL